MSERLPCIVTTDKSIASTADRDVVVITYAELGYAHLVRNGVWRDIGANGDTGIVLELQETRAYSNAVAGFADLIRTPGLNRVTLCLRPKDDGLAILGAASEIALVGHLPTLHHSWRSVDITFENGDIVMITGRFYVEVPQSRSVIRGLFFHPLQSLADRYCCQMRPRSAIAFCATRRDELSELLVDGDWRYDGQFSTVGGGVVVVFSGPTATAAAQRHRIESSTSHRLTRPLIMSRPDRYLYQDVRSVNAVREEWHLDAWKREPYFHARLIALYLALAALRDTDLAGMLSCWLLAWIAHRLPESARFDETRSVLVFDRVSRSVAALYERRAQTSKT